MVNVIVPISKNGKNYVKILEKLSNISSVRVLLGVTEDEKENLSQFATQENMSFHVYEKGSNIEEIINSLQKYIQQGSVMIMRKPIKMEEFNRFISQRKDVVTCERKMGKIKAFFFMIWQSILKMFLGVRLYAGNPTVIYFSEEISAVLAQSYNLSYSSRVDRWRGVEQAVVEVDGEVVKTPVDKKANTKYIIGGAICLAVATVVTVFVCIFAQMSIIIGLLLACLDIIALATALIMAVMIGFNSAVGNKKFKDANEVEE
ncbi:MAG: hypothetical protein J6C53_01260 [Clostridia bacterium]|nr:hypothetical protein [Clostridia bacterium]